MKKICCSAELLLHPYLPYATYENSNDINVAEVEKGSQEILDETMRLIKGEVELGKIKLFIAHGFSRSVERNFKSVYVPMCVLTMEADLETTGRRLMSEKWNSIKSVLTALLGKENISTHVLIDGVPVVENASICQVILLKADPVLFTADVLAAFEDLEIGVEDSRAFVSVSPKEQLSVEISPGVYSMRRVYVITIHGKWTKVDQMEIDEQWRKAKENLKETFGAQMLDFPTDPEENWS